MRLEFQYAAGRNTRYMFISGLYISFVHTISVLGLRPLGKFRNRRILLPESRKKTNGNLFAVDIAAGLLYVGMQIKSHLNLNRSLFASPKFFRIF